MAPSATEEMSESESEEAQSSDTPPQIDYGRYRLAELKAMLRAGGLPVGGNKPALVARLHDAQRRGLGGR